MEKFITTMNIKNKCVLRREIVAVKTVFYLNGQKITRKDLNELLGAAAVRELVRQAKETFFMDSNILNQFYLGSYGYLTIYFM